MNTTQKFPLLRKVHKALGLADQRIEELINRIQEWLLDDAQAAAGESEFPYHLREDFLSPAELNFYRVLLTAVVGWCFQPSASIGASRNDWCDNPYKPDT